MCWFKLLYFSICLFVYVYMYKKLIYICGLENKIIQTWFLWVLASLHLKTLFRFIHVSSVHDRHASGVRREETTVLNIFNDHDYNRSVITIVSTIDSISKSFIYYYMLISHRHIKVLLLMRKCSVDLLDVKSALR